MNVRRLCGRGAPQREDVGSDDGLYLVLGRVEECPERDGVFERRVERALVVVLLEGGKGREEHLARAVDNVDLAGAVFDNVAILQQANFKYTQNNCLFMCYDENGRKIDLLRDRQLAVPQTIEIDQEQHVLG